MTQSAAPSPQPAAPSRQPAVPSPQAAVPNPQYAPPPAVVPGQRQHAPLQTSKTSKRRFAILALVAAGIELLLGPLNAIVFATVRRNGEDVSMLSLISELERGTRQNMPFATAYRRLLNVA